MDLLKACDSCMNNNYKPNTGPCYDCFGNSNWVKKPGDPNNYYWPELPEDLERWRVQEKKKKEMLTLYALTKDAVNTLAALCDRKSEIIIDALTGILWNKETADCLKKFREDKIK